MHVELRDQRDVAFVLIAAEIESPLHFIELELRHHIYAAFQISECLQSVLQPHAEPKMAIVIALAWLELVLRARLRLATWQRRTLD